MVAILNKLLPFLIFTNQSSVGVHGADVAAALATGHWGCDESINSSSSSASCSSVDVLLSRVIPRFFQAIGSRCSYHHASWAARSVRRCKDDNSFPNVGTLFLLLAHVHFPALASSLCHLHPHFQPA